MFWSLPIIRVRRQHRIGAEEGPGRSMSSAARGSGQTLTGPSAAGQSLAEFALVIPLFMIMLTAVIEFGFAANAFLGINRASQDAAGLAGQLGSSPGSDCVILSRVEALVGMPTDEREIQSVQIQRTTPSGNVIYAANAYTRSGSTDCTLADGSTVSVPYVAVGSGHVPYPESDRCAVLRGCPELGSGRDKVDTIAVQVTYRHRFITPLSGILGIFGGADPGGETWTFQHRNTVRMEPVL